jgi:phosphatidylglycerophosphatase A
MRRAAVWVATAFGAGYAPIAPGTAGSAVGVALYLLIRTAPAPAQLAVVGAITLVGIWAGSVAAEHFGREDPGEVVIDEIAGQLVTLVLTGATWRGALAGFLLFRVLDIIKPWPANRFERFPGGWGIMADDVMAALYGNALLQVAFRLLPWIQ